MVSTLQSWPAVSYDDKASDGARAFTAANSKEGEKSMITETEKLASTFKPL
jgi:hypothetical protein